jgi:hypothetical protein
LDYAFHDPSTTIGSLLVVFYLQVTSSLILINFESGFETRLALLLMNLSLKKGKEKKMMN